jgi:Uncharacterised nucleotidyltransferase
MILAALFGSRTVRGAPVSPRSESDWDALIRVAADELMLPGLYRRMKGLGEEVPAETGVFLQAVEDMNRERNERILDDALAIARVLNEIGIEPVFLKGAAYLVEDVYPGLGCRYLCDLDLLIPASRPDAVQALEREGYRRDTSDSMAAFRHHHPQLQRPRAEDGSGSAPVELHHSLSQGAAQRLLSGEEVFHDSRLVERRGVRIRIPSPEHLVTHLILHSQIHHCYSERIWPPLRAMLDLAMLDRRFGSGLDWAAVRKRFRRHGEEHTLVLHLLQVNRALGMPLPFAIEPGWVVRARWMRRLALNRHPRLRFVDPVYLSFSILSRRVRFLQSVVAAPGGLRQATRVLMRRGFYRRLLAEISLRQ